MRKAGTYEINAVQEIERQQQVLWRIGNMKADSRTGFHEVRPVLPAGIAG